MYMREFMQTVSFLLREMAQGNFWSQVERFGEMGKQEFVGKVVGDVGEGLLRLLFLMRKIYYQQKVAQQSSMAPCLIKYQKQSQTLIPSIPYNPFRNPYLIQCTKNPLAYPGCLCCSASLDSSIWITHTVPMFSIDRYERNENEKLIFLLELAKIVVCLLNEGGGVLLFGGKETGQGGDGGVDVLGGDRDERYFGDSSSCVLDQLELFSPREVNSEVTKIGSILGQLSKQIYVGIAPSQFFWQVHQVKFQSFPQQQYTPATNTMGIIVKIVPKYFDRVYFLARVMTKNKKQYSVAIRNVNGQVCEINGHQLYQYVHRVRKEEKRVRRVKNYESKMLRGHIDFNRVRDRIGFAQPYCKKHYETVPVFEYDLSLILVIESNKKLLSLQRSLKQMKSNSICFHICQPHKEVKKNMGDRIFFINIDLRLLVFQAELRELKFPRQLAFVMTGVMEVGFCRKGYHRRDEILRNMNALINKGANSEPAKIYLRNQQDIYVEIRFRNNEQVVLAFVYLKSEGCKLQFVDYSRR